MKVNVKSKESEPMNLKNQLPYCRHQDNKTKRMTKTHAQLFFKSSMDCLKKEQAIKMAVMEQEWTLWRQQIQLNS